MQGLLAVLIAAVTLLAAPAAADPQPTAEQLRKQLSRLQKDFDTVVADYNANRVALAAAARTERSAAARLQAAQRDFDAARRQISELAALAYQTPQVPFGLPMGASEPGRRLHAAAILHLQAQNQQAIIGRYATARDARRRAQEEAATKARDLRDRDTRLRAERQKAEKLVAKITDRIDRLLIAPGVRGSDGSWAPELPSGPDNITARTRMVRDQVKQRFSLTGVGCYRSLQDGGEHPQGRACDFMITRGGARPSPAQKAQGDALAAWAIKNASRLGIKYVIFYQRIWQGSGWKAMSSRGGVTANHQDHVHISMH
ncbi:coiled-coil domain-containing protein [Nonomuraea rubra]